MAEGRDQTRCLDCYGEHLTTRTELDEDTAKVAALAYLGYSNLDIESEVGRGIDVRAARREFFDTFGEPPDQLDTILAIQS